MANTINASTLRLTGLSSGMDTDAMVQSMMQIEQLKMNRLLRKQTTYEWKSEALTDIQAKLKSLQETYLKTTGSGTLMLSSSYLSYTAETSSASKAVSVKVNSNDPIYDKLDVDVYYKASAATATGDSIGKLDTSKSFADLVTDGEMDLQFGLLYDANGNPVMDEDGLTQLSGFAFEINGEYFYFTEDQSLDNMISAVNASDAGVTMYYSELTNNLVIKSDEIGADSSFEITNVIGNAFAETTDAGGVTHAAALGIDVGSTGTMEFTDGASDAVVGINGTIVTSSTNTITVDGFTFTINDVTASGDYEYNAATNSIDQIAGGTAIDPGTITFNVTKDVSQAFDNIKAFVDAYNELIRELEALTSEKKDSDYYPLTEEEKAELTEAEIALWEEKAKQGLLGSDNDLDSLLSSLRNAMFISVEAAGFSPADIGLSTGNYFDGYRGEIVLDEDKLMAALEADVDAVYKCFTNISDDYNEQGFLHKINTCIDDYIKKQQTSLDTLEKQMQDMAKSISDMEEKLIKLEEKYYAKFAAMETAMATLNSQYDAILSLLNTGS